MSTRQQKNTLYARALKIGLAISVAAHAALFGFGRLSAPSPASRAELTTVAEPEASRDRTPTPEPEVTWEAAASIASRPVGATVPTPADAPSPVDLSESTAVARASTERPIPPLVPRPRIDAITTEQGFAPVTVDVPTWMLADGKAGTARAGNGGRGITIGVIGTGRGGTCKPVPGGWKISNQ